MNNFTEGVIDVLISVLIVKLRLKKKFVPRERMTGLITSAIGIGFVTMEIQSSQDVHHPLIGIRENILVITKLMFPSALMGQG